MKKRIWFISGGSILCILFVIIILSQKLTTTLEIRVLDAVSKSWVYNSTIRFQNRVIRGFKSLTYTFRNVKTGRHILSVSAPYYESKELPVSIHPGKNRLQDPLELTGHTIPGMDSISIFEKKQDDDMFIDIRLVGKNGHAIVDHPCLPVRILTRISVQLVNKEYEYYREGMSLERGKLLYFGEAEWTWNPGLTATYRYAASIPLGEIAGTPAPYWIIDYLVLIPNPLAITPEQIESVVQKVYIIEDTGELIAYLAGMKDTINYHITVKPNIENLAGGNE
ncbi:MAG: hypothetical protein JXB88_18240 [Spirochaetales bacterium]|nr:hypothetical protein [Spirochaetales bacterium]